MTQWKLVPIEPTPEMIAANGQSDSPEGKSWLAEDARQTWAAMLAAAPAPDGAITNEGTKVDAQPVAWLVEFRLRGSMSRDTLIVQKYEEALQEVDETLITSITPLYTRPSAVDVWEMVEALKAFSNYVRDAQMSTDGAVTYSTTTINHLVFLARAALAKWEGK